jgi:hypothetical protein
MTNPASPNGYTKKEVEDIIILATFENLALYDMLIAHQNKRVAL